MSETAECLAALSSIVKILESFSSDDRWRILNSTMLLLGFDAPVIEPRDDEP